MSSEKTSFETQRAYLSIPCYRYYIRDQRWSDSWRFFDGTKTFNIINIPFYTFFGQVFSLVEAVLMEAS